MAIERVGRGVRGLAAVVCVSCGVLEPAGGPTGEPGSRGGKADDGAEAAAICREVRLLPDLGGASGTAIAFDHEGRLHALYVDATDRVLVYAVRGADGTFARTVVDDAEVVDEEPFLGLDAGGDAHAVYRARVRAGTPAATVELRYRTGTLSAWRSRPSLPEPPWTFDVALDAGGRVVVARRFTGDAAGTSRVTLHRFVGAAWVEVFSHALEGEPSAPLALALDARGAPWLAFVSQRAAGRVLVAAPVGEAEGYRVTESPCVPGPRLDGFVVDDGGTAHLLSGTHVYGSGDFWSEEPVRSPVPGSRASWPRVGLDPSGRVVIAWTRAQQSGYGWPYSWSLVVETLTRGPEGWEGTWASIDPGYTLYDGDHATSILGFDPAGRPVVGSQPSEHVGLELFEAAAGDTFARSSLDVRANVSGSALARGADGTLFGAVSLDGHLALLAIGPGGAAEVRRTALEIDVAAAGLAVDDDGTPVLAALADGEVRVVRFNGATPSEERIPFNAPTYGRAVSVAAHSGTTHVFVAYQPSSGYGPARWLLWHAARDAAGTWETGMVANPMADADFGVVVDGGGEAFVRYRIDAHRVALARRRGGVWQAAALATSGNDYRAAIGLDGSDRPCVAHTRYLDDPYGDFIMLTCLDGDRLDEEFVTESSPLHRQIVATGTDAAGRMQVLAREAYSTGTAATLHTRAEAGWVTAPVDGLAPGATALGAVARIASLRRDPTTGRAYLSVCD